ncbi:MAG TPA: winged helix-turn-helix domain-containing protein [Solirubrobacteraceae bacterium]
MPEMEYRYPILRVISDNGGRVPTSEAVAAVGELVKDKLLPADLEMLGKKPRWEARAQFTRLRLIEEGLMKKDSPRGVWEITNEGEEAVKKQLRSDAVASPRAKRAMAGAS